jgi:hypothetical protein
MTTAKQKLKRLYQSIVDGIVELDDLSGEQITVLKARREKVKAPAPAAPQRRLCRPLAWDVGKRSAV